VADRLDEVDGRMDRAAACEVLRADAGDHASSRGERQAQRKRE
jgi:hypothetical protein